MIVASRDRFILLVTTAYAVFSLTWILLSDSLLTNFANLETIQRLSTIKGFFYVMVSSAMLYLALRAVPAMRESLVGLQGDTTVIDADSRRAFRWLSYSFAMVLPVTMLLVRAHMLPNADDRPLMIVLMLPIIASALLGGLWPGMLATAVSALGLDYLALAPLHSFAIADDVDRLQWGFLIGNGLAVSVLSELLRHALSHANAQRRLLNTVVAGTSDAIFVKDIRGRYLLINEAGAKMTGKPVSAIIGHDDTAIFPAASAQLLMTTDRAIMDAAKTQTHEENVNMLDGHKVVFLVTKGPYRDAQGRVVGLFGISRDVTEHKQSELALRSSEAAMKAAQRLAGVGNWTWDLCTDLHSWSEEIYQIYGRDTHLPPARYPEVQHYFTAQSWDTVTSAVEHAIQTGSAYELDAEVVRPDGSHRWVTLRGEVTRDAAGVITGLQGTVQDITVRKESEISLREAANVFDSSYEGIMVVSPDKKISKVNPAFTRITGYSALETVGQSPRMLSSGRHGTSFYDDMWRDLTQNGFWRGEIWNRRKSGEIYPELLSISVVHDVNGVVQNYIGMFWDLTQEKTHEAELDRVAHYDTLTGTPNRRLLTQQLQQTIEQCQRSDRVMAVCLLDLDGFKLINDQHGQAAGDQVLRGVAENLKQVLRDDDALARLGGDEFVLLLSNLTLSEDVALILERVQNAIGKPINVDGDILRVTASIGVSLYPQDNSNPDALLRHAEQAMFLSKEAGKNCYRLFNPESDRKEQSHRKYLDELDAALRNDQFVLFFQPKVDLLSGQIVGVEALIRWRHPERGLLPPAEFLPAIDGSTLEIPLGEWVIRTALAQTSTWLGEGLSIQVSVNVSPNHLLQPDFQSRLKLALEQRPEVNPSLLELEVLESAAIGDVELAVETLQRCRALGVHFSLDDFGTGYSSLTHLRKLPVDVLKIDQSFVRGMLDDPDDLGIVEGVIRLAGAFHRQVIAEGVETLAHGAALIKLGCRLAQGYGVAKPMPAEEFPAWCDQWQQQQRWYDLST